MNFVEIIREFLFVIRSFLFKKELKKIMINSTSSNICKKENIQIFK